MLPRCPAPPSPAAWAALTAVTELDLSGNTLTGTLPDAWSGLSSVQRINLAANHLHSTVPAAWALGMTALSRMIVDGWVPCPLHRCTCLPSSTRTQPSHTPSPVFFAFLNAWMVHVMLPANG